MATNSASELTDKPLKSGCDSNDIHPGLGSQYANSAPWTTPVSLLNTDPEELVLLTIRISSPQLQLGFAELY